MRRYCYEKITSLLLTIALVLILIPPAFATQPIPPEPEDYGEPISETTYYDTELDAIITDRVYFVPGNQNVSLRDKSGNGWYKNERVHQWQGKDITTTTFAKGYFVWGNGKVSVSSPSGGYDKIPSDVKILENEWTTGTGRYGLIFNNYAYVTYTLVLENFAKGKQDCSVTIRVSESGNAI